MTRIARCAKKPVEQCELARDEDYIEVVNLEEYACPHENCGLYFIDDPSEQVKAEETSPSSGSGTRGSTDEASHMLMAKLSSPAARLGVLVTVMLVVAYFVSNEESDVSCEQDANQAHCQVESQHQCQNLPPLATGAVQDYTTTDMNKLQRGIELYQQCGRPSDSIVAQLSIATDGQDGAAAFVLGDIYNPDKQVANFDDVQTSWKAAYTYYRKAYCADHPAAAERGNQLRVLIEEEAEQGNIEAIELLRIWQDDFKHVSCL